MPTFDVDEDVLTSLTVEQGSRGGVLDDRAQPGLREGLLSAAARRPRRAALIAAGAAALVALCGWRQQQHAVAAALRPAVASVSPLGLSEAKQEGEQLAAQRDYAPTQSVNLDEFVQAAFPGDLYNDFWRLRPSLDEGGARANEASPNCSEPGPEVYFGDKMGVEKLYHNKDDQYPMATDYMDTSLVLRPLKNEQQMVVGMTEMLSPYYLDNSGSAGGPYHVRAVKKNDYATSLHRQCLECALRGRPADSRPSDSAEYPVRVVIKNAAHGEACRGDVRARSRCSLRTSWGADPAKGSWRRAAQEMGSLVDLCLYWFKCDIKRVSVAPAGDWQAPQVFLFRVMSELPASEAKAATHVVRMPADPARCGEVEAGVSYETTPPWNELQHVPDKEMCCALCGNRESCKSWTWVEDAELRDGNPSVCWLNDGALTAKVKKAGHVSGLMP